MTVNLPTRCRHHSRGILGTGLPGEGGAEAVHDGMFAFLQHRNYRIFFFAQLVSLTGTWMQMVAEGWLVYSLTRSPMSLGIVSFLHTLPVTLLTFLGVRWLIDTTNGPFLL